MLLPLPGRSDGKWEIAKTDSATVLTGPYVTLDTNTAASTTSGQWYDLYLRLDGSSVEVWRALTGQTKTRVLSTTQENTGQAPILDFFRNFG